MSVQFGRWNFDGKRVDRDYLEKAKTSIAPYGPDDAGSYSKNNISILYHAFQTTKESLHETQPHVTSCGAVLTWDGRLDNRADLIQQLRGVVTSASTDVAIAAAAYTYWGSDCFAMLIGDWALSIWDPNTRSLILAKDPIGTRHLYYTFDDNKVTWSTILDPLVLFAGKTFALCEEYIAGWFSFFPAAHLTPYVGIHSVPPSSSVLLRLGKHTVSKYWNFDSGKRIRYHTDCEYEEHFRAAFAESVRRRLRSHTPVLAELSGGMDSASVVCMADEVIGQGNSETPRLDTVSYYDDSETNWNERAYFTRVEEKRGRIGFHINVCNQNPFSLQPSRESVAVMPGSNASETEISRALNAQMSSQGNRVVLSGIGGDEVTGGVPTPIPEFEDLLAGAHFGALARRLKVWALSKRKPWFHLLLDAARGFFPPALIGLPKHKRPAPWLNSEFVKRNHSPLQGYESRLKLFGPPPSFQENLHTLEALRRQLECSSLQLTPLYEKRYPYLDRCLLEFLYSIPREQLARPAQRRSVMRRALAGIVPDAILDRRRKAFVVRRPMASIAADWPTLLDVSQSMRASSLGILDSASFLDALEKARNGREVTLVHVARTLGIEFWLRNLEAWGVLRGTSPDAVLPGVEGYHSHATCKVVDFMCKSFDLNEKSI